MKLGHIVCDFDGNILESSGEFASSPKKAAKTVEMVLRETRLVLKSAPLNDITISSLKRTIVVTTEGDNIHIVSKKETN